MVEEELWVIGPGAFEPDPARVGASVTATFETSRTADPPPQQELQIRDLTYTWTIDAVTWQADRTSPVSLVGVDGQTDAAGCARATYTAGTLAGTAVFAALDETAVDLTGSAVAPAPTPRLRATQPPNLHPQKHVRERRVLHDVYTVITDPDADNCSGKPSGVRSRAAFGIGLTALYRTSATGAPEGCVEFTGQRPDPRGGDGSATSWPARIRSNAPSVATAGGVTTYTYVAGQSWDVTQVKGRWRLDVVKTDGTALRSTPAVVKIDKRWQVFYVATTYVGAHRTTAGGSGNCTALVYRVYSQVGLLVGEPRGSVEDRADATAEHSPQRVGALVFYGKNLQWPRQTPAGALDFRHVAVSLGGGVIVDSNCLNPAQVNVDLVHRHSDDSAEVNCYGGGPQYRDTAQMVALDRE